MNALSLPCRDYFLMAFTTGFYGANTQSHNTHDVHGHHDFDNIDSSRYESDNRQAYLLERQ